MAQGREWGELGYTLTDLVIASYNINTNTFGTPESLAEGQMFVAEAESDTDELRAYGRKTALLTVPVGTKLTISAGGIDYSALGLMGVWANNTVSGASGNRVRTADAIAGGGGLGYFGAIGVGALENGGIFTLGMKAVMLDTLPTITQDGTANKFNMAETAARGLPVSTTKLFRIKAFEAVADWVKPTTAAEFLAYFN